MQSAHKSGFHTEVTEAVRTGEVGYCTGAILAVPALRQDGVRISVECTILAFRGDDGRILGIAAVPRDVTSRFEQIRTLQRELAALRSGAGG